MSKCVHHHAMRAMRTKYYGLHICMREYDDYIESPASMCGISAQSYERIALRVRRRYEKEAGS